MSGTTESNNASVSRTKDGISGEEKPAVLSSMKIEAGPRTVWCGQEAGGGATSRVGGLQGRRHHPDGVIESRPRQTKRE